MHEGDPVTFAKLCESLRNEARAIVELEHQGRAVLFDHKDKKTKKKERSKQVEGGLSSRAGGT